MKSEIIRSKKSRVWMPPLGFNPAAIGGNAAGAHKTLKGKGAKYDRNREKRNDRECRE